MGNQPSVQALKGVSFEMNEGEILGLLGPNGAGKTTLISILTSLETSTSGQASIFGHNVETKKMSEWLKVKNLFGLVPQEIVNHGFFTVWEVLGFVSGYHGISKNEEHMEYLLKKLSLWEHREKRVNQLSGGMKRRFMIAKSLVHKPKLLLLDEPTAGVDVELRNTLWSFVRELHKQGVAILLTTHYLEEAEKLCDRVAIIDQGEIKKVGQTEKLIASLTQRKVVIKLKKAVQKCESQYLILQTEGELQFKLPASMEVGDLLHSIRLDLSAVTDFRIQEGTLQEAFMHVLERKEA